MDLVEKQRDYRGLRTAYMQGNVIELQQMHNQAAFHQHGN